MDEKEILLRLFQVVAGGLTHSNYAHVTKKRRLYRQLVIGENLDKLLKQFVRREDKELFDQRVALTQHIVTAVCANLLAPRNKVPRSNAGHRVLAYREDKTDNKIGDLETALKRFWGSKSWKDYLSTKVIELDNVDSNAFVVIEWKNFDNEKELAQPYPFEVSSIAAVDYKIKNEILQYLTVKNKHFYKTDFTDSIDEPDLVHNPTAGFTEGEKYTLYGQNQTWQLLQVAEAENDGLAAMDKGVAVTLGKDENGNAKKYVKLGEKYFRFIDYITPHNLGSVPAFRVGSKRDLATEGATFVNPLNDVEPYLLKTIKVNSEFDLVAKLLAMPQQIRLGEPCNDTKCMDGYYGNGDACGTCKGTNLAPTAPSAQDAIIIPKPAKAEEQPDLSKYITYIHPPVDIVEWQEKYIDKLTAVCKTMMYNGHNFTRKNVAETEGSKEIDMQNVYDTLYPFAVNWGKLWTFGVNIIAKIIDRDKDLVATYSFSADFKFKSLEHLTQDLVNIKGINNPTLAQHIKNDIAGIVYAEKPLELLRYNLKQTFDPFAGKSEKEIIVLMASPWVQLKEKILNANFSLIFDELEIEYAAKKSNNNFYKLTRSMQREAIYKKVEAIKKALEEENPSPELTLGE